MSCRLLTTPELGLIGAVLLSAAESPEDVVRRVTSLTTLAEINVASYAAAYPHAPPVTPPTRKDIASASFAAYGAPVAWKSSQAAQAMQDLDYNCRGLSDAQVQLMAKVRAIFFPAWQTAIRATRSPR